MCWVAGTLCGTHPTTCALCKPPFSLVVLLQKIPKKMPSCTKGTPSKPVLPKAPRRPKPVKDPTEQADRMISFQLERDEYEDAMEDYNHEMKDRHARKKAEKR